MYYANAFGKMRNIAIGFYKGGFDWLYIQDAGSEGTAPRSQRIVILIRSIVMMFSNVSTNLFTNT